MREMMVKRRFYATWDKHTKYLWLRLSIFRKSQYELRFKKWGIRKNRTSKEWKAIESAVTEREAKGKETEVRIDGKPISEKKLRKEMARYRVKCQSQGGYHGLDTPRLSVQFWVLTVAKAQQHDILSNVRLSTPEVPCDFFQLLEELSISNSLPALIDIRG